MSFEQISLTTEDGVARITLNRPEQRNAMTPQMGEEIRDAVTAINADPTVRVTIIRGSGKSFCAGADLSTLSAEAGDGDPDGTGGLGGGERFYRLFLSIRNLEMPSIAAVNGHAIGAGLCFALGADIRIARAGAKMGMTFVKLGFHPGMAATWTLPRLVGPAIADELLYTGRLIEADEAARIGLVNRVEGEGFDEAVENLATEINSAAPLAVRSLKANLRGSADRTIDEALAVEASTQARTFQSADAAEGVRAIRERRTPVFEGR